MSGTPRNSSSVVQRYAPVAVRGLRGRFVGVAAIALGTILLLPVSLHAQTQPGDLLRTLRIGDAAGGFQGHLLDDDDGFGSAVTRIGDLDGNGVDELAVGAPRDDDGGADRGAVWILFRGAGGKVLRAQKISSTQGLFQGALDDGDSFGHAIACVGDLDGNGLSEIAVGAPGDDDGGSVIFPDPSVGAVWILYLRRDGKVGKHAKISATTGELAGPLNELDRFGSAIAPMGDFGGDGTVDIATAGAVPDPITFEPIGYAIVAFMDADGTIATATELQQPAGAKDAFGSSITSIPDIDGDGFQELVIGAHRYDGSGSNRGAVWIAYMLPAGIVKSYSRIDDNSSAFEPDLADGDALGFSVHGLGDDDGDGDGQPDLFVGAIGDNGFGQDRGAVWRLSLSDGTWDATLSTGTSGQTGTPSLVGSGPLLPGTATRISLTKGAPGQPAWLVAGTRRADAPFLGGVLLPEPQLIRGPYQVRADGTVTLHARWPAGVAPASTLYYQMWIADAAGPQGYAASNGLSSTTR